MQKHTQQQEKWDEFRFIALYCVNTSSETPTPTMTTTPTQAVGLSFLSLSLCKLEQKLLFAILMQAWWVELENKKNEKRTIANTSVK